MAGGSSQNCLWSRRVAVRLRSLRVLVRDTQQALQNVADILAFDHEIANQVHDIGSSASRTTALVIFGTSPAAKARLVNCVLGQKLLPEQMPRGCKWIRIQYGSSTQVQLILGNTDFQLIEELECNSRPWSTLPVQDLIRNDKTDFTTILEVELNNSFLKDGLKIIIPPDIEQVPEHTSYRNLKKLHSELYSKRDLILRNYQPVYMYAIDKIERCIFCENIGQSVRSSSDDDFWSTYNLYYMTRMGAEMRAGAGAEVGGSEKDDSIQGEEVENIWQESGTESVFTAENTLDLHQIMEIDRNAQLVYVLLADSLEKNKEEGARGKNDATESTEETYKPEEKSDQGLPGELIADQESQEKGVSIKKKRLLEEQSAFMNDLLDQWELMTGPYPKHYVKSQWTILDDEELLRTSDQNLTNPVMSPSGQAMRDKQNKSGRSEGNTNITKSRQVLLNKVLKFAADCLHTYILNYSTKLSEIHVKLLQQFILASFDLARELQVVPKKIQYVAKQEQQLYETLYEKFSEGDKKQELLQIMKEVIVEMKSEVYNMDWSVDDLPCHLDQRFQVSNSVFFSTQSSPERATIIAEGPSVRPGDPPSPSDAEEAVTYDTYNLDDYEIIHTEYESAPPSDCCMRVSPDDTYLSSEVNLIPVENERDHSLSSSAFRSFMTPQNRGLSSSSATMCTNTVNISMKQASLDVQRTVLSKLSRKISMKLVKFVDCLRDSYFGTLQRCLESLESSCRQELGGRPASEAMRQILSVARQVDLQPYASFSLLRSLVESIRRLLAKLRLGGSEIEDSCCVLSPVWRRQVAVHCTNSLNAARLAKVICTQILERLGIAHERYQSALCSLESALASRLHHTEDVKLTIRKKYAPEFARLCLESTSMCDLLMYGTPDLGREIGRGQYGVVYAARGSWAGRSPVAVKSVIPADERHYHELAMEFFYTRSIPAHPRIVRLYGSIVQHHGGGSCPVVLLVSERKVRDLHTAVRAGLSRSTSLRISADIVEGIRYLHSLGLVHRDIKMKNVLLDSENRASLTDLGFCAAEALISGSVVGTPVHMAPELLDGDYDAAVDVYAFGILFWYVCAGTVKLPSAFELFQNKEQLWSRVRKGRRPERLPSFSDESWEIMESCWASEPSQRAHLGNIQPKLENMLLRALQEEQRQSESSERDKTLPELLYEDSLDITGLERSNV